MDAPITIGLVLSVLAAYTLPRIVLEPILDRIADHNYRVRRREHEHFIRAMRRVPVGISSHRVPAHDALRQASDEEARGRGAIAMMVRERVPEKIVAGGAGFWERFAVDPRITDRDVQFTSEYGGWR